MNYKNIDDQFTGWDNDQDTDQTSNPERTSGTSAIDKEVFDAFFKENYCELEYKDVKKDFEALAAEGLDYLFDENTDITKLTRKNFIAHMNMDAYGAFEEILEDATDSLNSEILDAVIDVSSTMKDADDVTFSYWDKNEDLLKKFLRQLYDDKIEAMIREA